MDCLWLCPDIESYIFSAAFSTPINPVLRLSLPAPKLESVPEKESVEEDTVTVHARKVENSKEYIEYNKELKDERESKTS